MLRGDNRVVIESGFLALAAETESQHPTGTDGFGSGRRPVFPEALDSAGMLERSAGSSMDRASDYGSEGWEFESLRARCMDLRI